MPIEPSALAQILGPHPARRMPFAALYDGLQQRAKEGRINISRLGPLELYSYSRDAHLLGAWDVFTLMARGLILDVVEQKVVATPFPKFFNFRELGIEPPSERFEATEKLDGSLGILFHHAGAWRVTTRGQLDSLQGRWASDYLLKHVNASALAPGTTYLVEIVYAENRIVIPYTFEGLVLLGAYDVAGVELTRAQLEDVAQRSRLRLAKSFPCQSFAELVNVVQSLGKYEEGYVVRFASGMRMKLKGEAYCRLHRLLSSVTPLALWDAMAKGDDLDAMRRDLPEEMRGDFDRIVQLLQSQFDGLLTEVLVGRERMAHLSNKELGLLLQGGGVDLTPMQQKFAFSSRHPSFQQRALEAGEIRTKLFGAIRPGGNVLSGYTPSNAMTRFMEEDGGLG